MAAMKVVATNSEADLARERAKYEVDWALRDLTANLFRVTRGAGKPSEVLPQAVALVAAMRAFWDAAGEWPFNEFNEMLEVHGPDRFDGSSNEEAARSHAEALVIDGALQVAASKLLGQIPQIARGQTEMYEGIHRVLQVQEDERRKWAAEADTPARRKAALAAAIARAKVKRPKK